MSGGPGASYAIFRQLVGETEYQRIKYLTKLEMLKTGLPYRQAWFMVTDREYPKIIDGKLIGDLNTRILLDNQIRSSLSQVNSSNKGHLLICNCNEHHHCIEELAQNLYTS